ncbi:hypothetical protein AGABI2DRAFT_187357 [Agaricus bisporus var. bisporus H97]|uniref:hypothetical protein n=1 Tax=Agaricus bisporus var. bisporus (strain H97 / ATCC MYA-4626 / FGSC 10389) TaxID=936046 RepID=UPI00029F6136|nr:hypothetical protein AGABI2DRAFT_187357 [Agaricus bisporus var. bisporus H97]EKV44617.1 hypothetical protein AGABI2DRAFT_187357 [Agaricus bisporus var. bisporus H97]
MPSSDPESFRTALTRAKNVLILSGAGLSAGSGIATYRNAENSLWNNFDPKKYATLEAFKDDPVGLWTFYHRRRSEYLLAKPNPAHYALGLLAHPPVLARIAPCHSLSRPSSIRHITQNIDALALRVIESLPSDANMSSESSRVEEAIVEMHGDIFVTRCISCQHINRSYEPQLASTLAHLELQSQPSMKPDGIITVDQLPKCGGDAWAGSNRYGRCGGLLRPEVVWFGEVPPQSGEIARMMSTCDMLLVVGTSSIVRPAADYAAQVKKNGGIVAVFNLGHSKGEEEADFVFIGPCEETLPEVLQVKKDIEEVWPEAYNMEKV